MRSHLEKVTSNLERVIFGAPRVLDCGEHLMRQWNSSIPRDLSDGIHAELSAEAFSNILQERYPNIDCNTNQGSDFSTLLHFACEVGNVDIIRFLVQEKNVDINRASAVGTP